MTTSPNISDKSITQSPTQSAVTRPRVDFDKVWFEDVIEQKGYELFHETAISCPCVSAEQGANNPQSNCRNCGGVGWVFVNPFETQMIMSSINLQSKYKEWSEEKMGTVKLTAKDGDDLSFMDRLTLKNGTSIHKEALHVREYEGDYFFLTVYDITEVIKILGFDGVDNKLKVMEQGVDYEIEYNKVKLISPPSDNHFTISVLYKYRPQFHVLDIPRETMVTRIEARDDRGKLKPVDLPVSAIARRTHILLGDKPYYWGTSDMFDNSFEK